jgi:uncharacterized damage-inducible protein DinB
MTNLVTVLRNHVDYTRWATTRLLQAADALEDEQRQQDFGTADKSVLGTMLHVFRSERTWLQRLQFGTLKIPWGLPEDWSGITEQWPALHTEWQEWGQRLTEEDPNRLLNYSDLKGRPWVQPVWQIVLHAVNHSTHHRGQVAGFLRALGKAPPSLDFIAFMREPLRN